MKIKKINLPILIFILLVLTFVGSLFVKEVSPIGFKYFLAEGRVRDLFSLGNLVFYRLDSPAPLYSNIRGQDLVLNPTSQSNALLGIFVLGLLTFLILGLVIHRYLLKSKSPLDLMAKIAVLLFIVSLASKIQVVDLRVDSPTIEDLLKFESLDSYEYSNRTIKLRLKSSGQVNYLGEDPNGSLRESFIALEDSLNESRSLLSRLNDFSKTPRGIILLLIIVATIGLGIKKLKDFIGEINELSGLLQIDMDSFAYRDTSPGFENIYGYKDEKKSLENFIEGGPGSLLIRGPRASGKTLFGQALLRDFKGQKFYLKAYELITHYTGGGNQMLEALFKNEFQEPRLVFIDDLNYLNTEQFIIMDGSPDENLIHNLREYMKILEEENIYLVVALDDLRKVFDKSISEDDFSYVLDLTRPKSKNQKALIAGYLEKYGIYNKELEDSLMAETKGQSILGLVRSIDLTRLKIQGGGLND